MNIPITCPAFAAGRPIPEKYTCDGLDVSPPLAWTNAPAGTKSFALIADDPDAPGGIWVHWVIYNLSPAATALAENTPRRHNFPMVRNRGSMISARPVTADPARPLAGCIATFSTFTRWTRHLI